MPCAAENYACNMTYTRGAMRTFEVRLLGPPQAMSPSGVVSFLSDKRYQLLAYLAYKHDWVNRDELAYLFWSETHDGAARHNLRQLLKRLKIVSQPEGLEIERERLRWQTSTDLEHFAQALVEQNLTEALIIYEGPFLQRLESGEPNEFNAWLEGERAWLHTRWRETVLTYAQVVTPRDASVWLKKLLEQDPLDEEAVQAYMRVSVSAGQSKQATNAYKIFASELEHDLGLAPSSSTLQLAKRIEAGTVDHQTMVATLSQLSSPAKPNLPSPTSALIGRELELSEMAHLLAQTDCRLLTLTGAGGVGKTRLALHAAYDMAQTYADGVYFVALEALTNSAAIPVHIAEVLGVKLQPEPEPLEQITNYLHHKSILLLLDNFEHLIDGATLVSQLVQNCSKLKVIVTSRERLNLEQEHLLPISGLTLPEPSNVLNDALNTDSARLFIERAKRVYPEFNVTEKDLSYLVDICHRLEGVPLALELAAVWIRVMPLSELARELAGNLDILESQSRNRVGRHRSIRAAFDYSWKLLSEKEKQTLRKLSVFRGGFSREAASLVTQTPIALLAALVDKSLLRVLPHGRYDRHPLLYQYTQEKLAEYPEEAAEVKTNHAKYFLSLAERAEPQLQGPEQHWWFGQLVEELDNLRLALDFLQVSNSVLALRLAAALGYFWEIRGHYFEGYHYLDELLRMTKDTGYIGTKAMLKAGNLAWKQGNHERAYELFEQSLVLAKSQADKTLCVEALIALGRVAELNHGDYQGARLHFEAALKLARALGDKILIANALRQLGAMCVQHAQYQQARHYYEESMELSRLAGDALNRGKSMVNLATVLTYLGFYIEAHRINEESLVLLRSLGDRHGEAITLLNLGMDADSNGDRLETLEKYQQSLLIFKELGDNRMVSHLLNNLGGTYQKYAEPLQAKVLLEESLSIQRQIGDVSLISHAMFLLGLVHSDLGDTKAAYQCYQDCIALCRKNSENWALMRALVALANWYIEHRDYTSAMEANKEALELAQIAGDKNTVKKALVVQTRLETMTK
jgi:predicted ATPase/DNA-binding SARP family transcriptional activator/uncharacterized protein HemY